MISVDGLASVVTLMMSISHVGLIYSHLHVRHEYAEMLKDSSVESDGK